MLQQFTKLEIYHQDTSFPLLGPLAVYSFNVFFCMDNFTPLYNPPCLPALPLAGLASYPTAAAVALGSCPADPASSGRAAESFFQQSDKLKSSDLNSTQFMHKIQNMYRLRTIIP